MPVKDEKTEGLGGDQDEKRTVRKSDRRWRSFTTVNGQHVVKPRSDQHSKEVENGHVSESGKDWGGALGGLREVPNSCLL